ncbi:MAG: domain S-box protein, partial [Phenylobacterium sp.]|nr:domain S-box protein [Phenylobacterium sp.]
MSTYHPHFTQGFASRLRRRSDGFAGRLRRALRPSALVEGSTSLLPRQWGYWHAIQFGVAMTLLPTLLIAPAGALAGDEYPFLTYFPAVVIAAGFAGWAAGAASLGAAAILVWRIAGSPGSSPWGADVLVPFLISAAVAGAAAAMMNTAVRHLALQKMATDAANQSLRASEEHNRRFLELSPQIPWTAAPSGLLTDIPERLARLTGVERAQLLGGGWAAVVHPDDLPGMRAAWEETLERGDSFDVESRFRFADGGYHWLRSRAYPYRNAAGEIIAWYGLSEDIQSRKQ